MGPFYIYIVTNPSKTCLYIGVTNHLGARLKEHYDSRGSFDTWAGRYYCYNLLYFEEFQYIDQAIAREKQLKKWRRAKKDWLIAMKNPARNFLNSNFPFVDRPKRRELVNGAVLYTLS